MKKILFILAAFTAISAVAQNTDAIQKKLDKSNSLIVDEKKSSLPSTWIDRASLFIDLSNVYTSKIVRSITMELAEPVIGKPISVEQVAVGAAMYNKNEFENFVVYSSVSDNTIQFWVPKKGNELAALNNALECLVKVKAMSEKDFNTKCLPLCDRLLNQYAQAGLACYNLGDKAKAADYFMGSNQASELMGKTDTLITYYCGIAFAESNQYEKAIPFFDKLLSMGDDQEGMVYIYLSNCYTSLKETDKAVKVLEDGFAKDPNNTLILSSIINIYLTNDMDPTKIITVIKKAEELDPKNASLYLAEGTIWDKLGDEAKSEEAFIKSIELDSSNFQACFNLGLVRARKSEALIRQAGEIDINDQKGYDAMMLQASDVAELAIEALEKAHEINKTEKNTVEILRQLYFQKRDKGDKYVERYKYFADLFETMK